MKEGKINNVYTSIGRVFINTNDKPQHDIHIKHYDDIEYYLEEQEDYYSSSDESEYSFLNEWFSVV